MIPFCPLLNQILAKEHWVTRYIYEDKVDISRRNAEMGIAFLQPPRMVCVGEVSK